jgi:hypothetical protein
MNITTPYLIQNMILRENPLKNPTLDQLYQMDYMGSSEFEFGSLPKSLKVFTKNFEDLKIEQSPIKNFEDSNLYLLGQEHTVREYKNRYIEDLINDKFLLKERTNIDFALKGKVKNKWNNKVVEFDFWRHPSAWWDIKNHIMFTFKQSAIYRLKDSIWVSRSIKIKEKQDEWY